MNLRARKQKRDYAALESQEEEADTASMEDDRSSVARMKDDDADDDDNTADECEEPKKKKVKPSKASKRQPKKKAARPLSAKAKAKLKAAEEAKLPKPHLPYDCIYRIMEYSDARVCHAFAFTSKTIQAMLTYDLVVKSAILGYPISYTRQKVDNRLKEHKYLGSRMGERIAKIRVGIINEVVVVPTPQRLLCLLNGQKCEMKHCLNRRKLGDAPETLECGLFACTDCVLTRSVPKHYVMLEQFSRKLGMAYVLSRKTMYMRKPYINSAGQRIGPAKTLGDVDDILDGKITEEEVAKNFDVGKQREFREACYAASSRFDGYVKDRNRFTQHEDEQKCKIKRDQIVEALKRSHGDAEWLEISLDRNEKHDRFTNPFMHTTIDNNISASLGKSTRFTKKNVDNYVINIAAHFDCIKKGNWPILEPNGEPVEMFWCSRWQAELKDDREGILKKVYKYKGESINDISFKDFAQLMLGMEDCCGKTLIREMLLKNSTAEFEDDLSRFWRASKWPNYGSSSFRIQCRETYRTMTAKYGRDPENTFA